MDTFYQAGQQAALEKLGYDLNDAHKVLQAAKKYVLPKASNRVLPALNPMAGQFGPAALSPVGFGGVKAQISGNKKLRKSLMDAMPSAPRPEPGMEEILNRDHPGFATVRSLTNNWKSPQVIIPGASDPQKVLSTWALAPGVSDHKLTPPQYKMLHSVMRGHELDEGRGGLGASMRAFGHNNADVILKEHNRIATLPNEFKPIRDIFQTVRGPREAERLKEYGVEYGQGERLNRHQRKHLSRLMEKKETDAGEAYFKQLKNEPVEPSGISWADMPDD